jgi:parallel beta-helix repeat protein/predicted outer membrane repeat protein
MTAMVGNEARKMNGGTKLKACLVISIFLLGTMYTVAAGQFIYVDADAPGSNDGSNWENAYHFLQDALDIAMSGDEIRVAQGVYTPTGPIVPVPPPDGAIDCNRYTVLNWSAGTAATSHEVFLGTNSVPPFVQSQILTVFYAGNLDSNTTYYWRIDEVNWWGTTTGVVWSLTTVENPPSPPPPPPPHPTNSSNRQDAEVTSGDRTATFRLINDVIIKGGYAGFGEPDPDSRDIDVYDTVLSGDLAGNDIDVNDLSDLLDEPSRAENSLHVVTGSVTDATAVLDGFTITAGNDNRYEIVPSPYPYLRPIGHGAGMCNHSGSPTLANCTFIRNTANSRGGGMCNWDESRPTITNCTFSGNIAEGEMATGGGMYSYSSSPTLTNCTFSGNSASYEGGGMYNSYSSLNITNCTFIGNSSYDSGGAVYIGGKSNQTLTNCIFIDNSARYFGGAMVIGHCYPTLINCTFRNNKTEYGGGGIFCYSEASPTLNNCEFTGNVTQDSGGGMHNTVSSSPTLLNCTFTGNSAGNIGGGIWNRGNSNPTLTNCIIWGNEAREGPEIAVVEGSDPSTVTVSYSDAQGGKQDVYVGPGCALIWGQGNIDTAPCFADPGYWGHRDDPNIVVEPNDPNALWVYGDYHLLPGSPCIDTGDPNYVAEPNEMDLDGKPRVIGDRIDMGAYEYVPPIPAKVRIIPRRISLRSRGKWIAAFIRLPEEYNVADIDPDTVLLQGDIEPQRFWFAQRHQIAIARFSREEVRNILSAGEVELTITGQLTDGTVFEGVDIIKVIDRGGGKMAR